VTGSTFNGGPLQAGRTAFEGDSAGSDDGDGDGDGDGGGYGDDGDLLRRRGSEDTSPLGAPLGGTGGSRSGSRRARRRHDGGRDDGHQTGTNKKVTNKKDAASVKRFQAELVEAMSKEQLASLHSAAFGHAVAEDLAGAGAGAGVGAGAGAGAGISVTVMHGAGANGASTDLWSAGRMLPEEAPHVAIPDETGEEVHGGSGSGSGMHTRVMTPTSTKPPNWRTHERAGVPVVARPKPSVTAAAAAHGGAGSSASSKRRRQRAGKGRLAGKHSKTSASVASGHGGKRRKKGKKKKQPEVSAIEVNMGGTVRVPSWAELARMREDLQLGDEGEVVDEEDIPGGGSGSGSGNGSTSTTQAGGQSRQRRKRSSKAAAPVHDESVPSSQPRRGPGTASHLKDAELVDEEDSGGNNMAPGSPYVVQL